MRNLKKVLCLVLSLAMMLSVMVVGSSAAFTDSKEIVNDTAVDMCVALHIINGYTDGSFRPTSNITRAEFSKMMCVMLNGGEAPAVATNSTPTFADVRNSAAWAEGYIEYCYTKGIVAGVGGGNFNPNGNITATEAAKMLLVALGYNADVEHYVGSDWALYVNVQANQDGLYKDLKNIDTGAALSRDNAAQMIWNTLQSYIISKSSSINRTDGSISDIYTKKDGTDGNAKVNLLAQAYDADDAHGGIMTGFIWTSSKGEWTYYFNDEYDNHDAGTPAIAIKSSVDYTNLYRQDCTVVYDKVNKTVYGIYPSSDDCAVIASGIIANLNDMKSSDTSVKVNGVSIDLAKTAGTTPVYFFTYGDNAPAVGNIYGMTDGMSNDRQIDPYSFVAIDYNANDKIDCFVVYPYAVGQISLLNATKVSVKSMNNNLAYPLTTDIVTENLKDIDVYEGMAKNDYVIYTPAAYTATGTADISPVDSVISGSVSRVSGNNITIDGTVYENLSRANFNAGNKVKDVVLVGGYIFMVDGANAADIDDYVVVSKLGNDNFGSAIAQVLFTDGTKQTVSLDKVYNEAGSEVAITAANVRGNLYTYQKNSDGDYTLIAASDNAKDAGFDKVLGTNVDSSSGKVKHIGGATIADDAVIFVQHKVTDATTGAASYKVITGAQLKKTAASTVTVLKAYANTNSSTNSSMVQMAYISTGTSSVASGESSYGYVVAKPAIIQNSDNAKVNELQIWTGSEIVTLATDDMTTAVGVEKKSIIEYTVNTDGEIDSIKVIVKNTSVIKNEGENDGVGIAAITSYDAAENDLVLNDNGKRLEIKDKDTTIFYIDNDDAVGYTDGSIQVASENPKGGYFTNCYYIIDNAGKELDLLVIDINNDMEGKM